MSEYYVTLYTRRRLTPDPTATMDFPGNPQVGEINNFGSDRAAAIACARTAIGQQSGEVLTEAIDHERFGWTYSPQSIVIGSRVSRVDVAMDCEVASFGLRLPVCLTEVSLPGEPAFDDAPASSLGNAISEIEEVVSA